MEKFYCYRITHGLMTIEEVPGKWREAVRALLQR